MVLPLVLCGVLALQSVAHADTPNVENASNPLHLAQAFLQYGVAFTGEFVAVPGSICSVSAGQACILGPGGGITVRLGRRLRSPFYLGGAYEFTKMDSSQLYRLAILQQLRAEGRYYISTGHTTEPYAMATVGAAGYGNLWGIDSSGPAFGLGIGAEFQLSTYLVVGLSLNYRAIFFTRFTDSAGTERPCSAAACDSPGFAHLFGFDLILESRAPL